MRVVIGEIQYDAYNDIGNIVDIVEDPKLWGTCRGAGAFVDDISGITVITGRVLLCNPNAKCDLDLTQIVSDGVKVWFEGDDGMYHPARAVYWDRIGSVRMTPYLVCRDDEGFIYRKPVTVGMSIICEDKDFRTVDYTALYPYDIPKFCSRPSSSFEEYKASKNVGISSV